MKSGLLRSGKWILWATNGLIISLNNAIYPNSLSLKDFLSAALEIKSCSAISKPLVLPRRRTRFVQCVIFWRRDACLFYNHFIMAAWTIAVFFFLFIPCLSAFWKWHNINLRLTKMSSHAENLKTGVSARGLSFGLLSKTKRRSDCIDRELWAIFS